MQTGRWRQLLERGGLLTPGRRNNGGIYQTRAPGYASVRSEPFGKYSQNDSVNSFSVRGTVPIAVLMTADSETRRKLSTPYRSKRRCEH